MKAEFHMFTHWWYRQIIETSCLKLKKLMMKENMVQMIKCNYYSSCAKKLSSAFLKLFQFFFLVISCCNFTSWWFHSTFNYVFLLLSPSFQYCSVCISVSLERVRWKAKISSSPVNTESPLAESYINTQKQYHTPVRLVAVLKCILPNS